MNDKPSDRMWGAFDDVPEYQPIINSLILFGRRL